jgi:hypothetical protein
MRNGESISRLFYLEPSERVLLEDFKRSLGIESMNRFIGNIAVLIIDRLGNGVEF